MRIASPPNYGSHRSVYPPMMMTVMTHCTAGRVSYDTSAVVGGNSRELGGCCALAMTLAEGVTIDTTAVEENTLLLDAAAAGRDDESCSRGTSGASTGDRVRRRLAVCLFLHIAGVAIVTQVYPRVSASDGLRQEHACEFVCW